MEGYLVVFLFVFVTDLCLCFATVLEYVRSVFDLRSTAFPCSFLVEAL